MEDLSRSIQRGEGVEGEAVLFGLTEPEAPTGVRGRRDVSGRFEIVSDMETPDIGVPESQFEVPKEEVRVKPPRLTIDRRTVSKHTEIIRKSVAVAVAGAHRRARAAAGMKTKMIHLTHYVCILFLFALAQRVGEEVRSAVPREGRADG